MMLIGIILTAVLIMLKLLGVVTVSWFLAFVPFLVVLALYGTMFFFILVVSAAINGTPR